MSTAWFNTAERRRLNGFQNRCLRQIWGVKPAYWSRVSNKHVLEMTGEKPLSLVLARQQLLLFAKAARAPVGSLLRDSTFCPGTLRPATDRYVRKVGRPRVDWVGDVFKLAARAAGPDTRLDNAIRDPITWQAVVDNFCKR